MLGKHLCIKAVLIFRNDFCNFYLLFGGFTYDYNVFGLCASISPACRGWHHCMLCVVLPLEGSKDSWLNNRLRGSFLEYSLNKIHLPLMVKHTNFLANCKVRWSDIFSLLKDSVLHRSTGSSHGFSTSPKCVLGSAPCWELCRSWDWEVNQIPFLLPRALSYGKPCPQ